MSLNLAPLVEHHQRLSDQLGLELLVVRDDLLPFPLSGNKVRKLLRELNGVTSNDVLLTNGGVDSNHCRTLAMLGARLGNRVHLVLHAGGNSSGVSLAMLEQLGATFEIVQPDAIGSTLDRAEALLSEGTSRVRRIAGGCHTPAGARAYKDVGEQIVADFKPDAIVVASGTGATQGGLVAAAHGTNTRVIGVSVARVRERGAEAVAEAAGWAGAHDADVTFIDEFRDGGYGRYSRPTEEAVALGWRNSLPLDPTYTGKAFAAISDPRFRSDYLTSGRVVFWHTGGLMNWISARFPSVDRKVES